MRLATLFALLLLFSACDGAAWESQDRIPLRIDIQSQFEDDRVRLEVGGVPIFDDRVTTEDVLSLARIVEASVPPGETEVTAIVNDGPSASLDLDTSAPGVVVVGFDGRTVSVQRYGGAPLYD